jgi:hypothetical protein
VIPIVFAIIVENMSNPLHQMIAEHLPQVNPTFSLGDFAGAIALIVSAITFYISHTQTSQSEQIKTSRDLMASINDKYEKVRSRGDKVEAYRLIGAEIFKKAMREPGLAEVLDTLRSVLTEIDYFAYLILKREIKDKVVLDYYKIELTRVIKYLVGMYQPFYQEFRQVNLYNSLQKLIYEWEIDLST